MWIWIADKSAQNFKQKHLTEVKIFQKVLGRGLLFWNTLYYPSASHQRWHICRDKPFSDFRPQRSALGLQRCLSVCLSHAGILSKRLNISSKTCTRPTQQSFRMTSSDLEWLSKIYNDTKRHARSLCDSWVSCSIPSSDIPTGRPVQGRRMQGGVWNKKLSRRRETTWCFMSLNINFAKLLRLTGGNSKWHPWVGRVSLLIVHSNYLVLFLRHSASNNGVTWKLD